MNIAFVLDDSLDSTDGIQQYILALGGYFSGRGHTVSYLVGETKRTDIPNLHCLSRNVKVRFNGNRMSMPLPARRQSIKRLLANTSFDIVHVQMPYSPLLAGRIIKATAPASRIVGTFHIAPDSVVTTIASRLLAIWSRPSLCKFTKVYSVSSAAQQFAKQSYSLDTTVLPNVVDLQRFAAGQRRTSRVPKIVFLGRLVPRKGCLTLLKAVSLLSQRSLNFEVIIGGKGPLLNQLQRYVEQQNLAARVSFSGFVSEAAKADFLAAADIAVFPSSGGESFGIVLLEAMATGRTVVLAADNPGYQAVLGAANEQSFPVNDASALAAKLEDFLSGPAARARALAWQDEHVKQFDIPVVGQQLEAEYIKLLAAARPA